MYVALLLGYKSRVQTVPKITDPNEKGVLNTINLFIYVFKPTQIIHCAEYNINWMELNMLVQYVSSFLAFF